MSVGSIWLSTCKDGCKPHVSQKSLKLHMWRWPKAACQSEILGITHVEIARSCMASQADILNPFCTPVRTRKCIFLSARVASSRSVFCVIGKLFHASAWQGLSYAQKNWYNPAKFHAVMCQFFIFYILSFRIFFYRMPYSIILPIRKIAQENRILISSNFSAVKSASSFLPWKCTTYVHLPYGSILLIRLRLIM